MTTRTRPYHHGDLRSVLLAEAAVVLRTEGADALSLRELARRADVSHAAPRRHFRDKQALLDALALDGFARLEALLGDAATTPGTFTGRLTAIGQAYAGFAVDDAALLDLMWTGKHRPGADAALLEAGERCLAAPAAMIAGAQEAGEIAGGPVDEVATTVFAAVQGLATLTTSGLLDPADLPDHVRAMATHLTDGLRPR